MVFLALFLFILLNSSLITPIVAGRRMDFLKGVHSILSAIVFGIVLCLIYFYKDRFDDHYLSNLKKAYPLSTGYVLATHYSNQLTESIGNVLSLQCWAASLPESVRIVEPFLHHESYLGFDLETGKSKASMENKVRLFDMYDVRQWKKYTSSNRMAGMVSWGYFLNHAPRQLILVDRSCADSSQMCMKCKENDVYKSPRFARLTYRFAVEYNFTIVRRACYQKSHHYTKNEFRRLIYGSYDPEETVVLFNHFEGFEWKLNKRKINIDLKKCAKFNNVYISTSRKIKYQSTKYVRKYFSFGQRPSNYISVMFNLESFLKRKSFQGKSMNWQMSNMQRCVRKIVEKVRSLKRKSKAKYVFLATDIGKYGLYRVPKTMLRDGVLQAGLKQLHNGLFDKPINLTARIESIASVKMPHYIGLIQSTLASNGTSLVLAGGSSTKKMTASMFFTRHAKKKNKNRLQTINEC